MEGIGEMTRFYIPPKAVGYQLMGSFLEHAPTGEPFFSTPSDDLLKQIVFNPDKVVQKAWVVYYNYIMLAQASTEEKSQGNQAENFRRNMRIALNDSSIFLEPRKLGTLADKPRHWACMCRLILTSNLISGGYPSSGFCS
ncbi:fungal specific transcription factor domain-containing protein [Colletotrichum tofieldiae]|nr:fungal specific transcription factor domain-containing protein [Colletotrichum tofieldiae]